MSTASGGSQCAWLTDRPAEEPRAWQFEGTAFTQLPCKPQKQAADNSPPDSPFGLAAELMDTVRIILMNRYGNPTASGSSPSFLHTPSSHPLLECKVCWFSDFELSANIRARPAVGLRYSSRPSKPSNWSVQSPRTHRRHNGLCPSSHSCRRRVGTNQSNRGSNTIRAPHAVALQWSAHHAWFRSIHHTYPPPVALSRTTIKHFPICTERNHAAFTFMGCSPSAGANCPASPAGRDVQGRQPLKALIDLAPFSWA